MQKFTHSIVLLVFLLIFNFVNSQSTSVDSTKDLSFTAMISGKSKMYGVFEKNEISYKNDVSVLNNDYVHHDHDVNHMHKHDDMQAITMLDIISSDESTDFNCSGGFCMNKAHYHKKGLTLKRQFFVYFIRISC